MMVLVSCDGSRDSSADGFHKMVKGMIMVSGIGSRMDSGEGSGEW